MAKILIADDEPAVRDVLARFVRGLGHEAIEARDGEEAVAKVREESPQLVLLDIRMPKMDGFGVLEELGAMELEIGVIMITGFHEDELGRRALGKGAFDYLCKPIDFDYLERAVWTKLQLMEV